MNTADANIRICLLIVERDKLQAEAERGTADERRATYIESRSRIVTAIVERLIAEL